MTRAEFSEIMRKITHFYPKFYEGSDSRAVFEDWYEFFENSPFEIVMKAVKAHVSTSKYAPSVADIMAQIVESFQQDKPTALQAFQIISQAVKRSNSKADAVREYNALPPILKKLVGRHEQLRDWSDVPSEAFQTVIMSAIRQDYTELTKREAKFYAFPAELQQTETWRIEAPAVAELPAPEKTKTVDEIIEEANTKASEHGMLMTEALREKNAEKVDAFLKPVTEKEKKLLEIRDQMRSERFLK